MKPVAFTFVDSKMLDLAEEQHENFNKFGLDHVIVRMPDVHSYDTALWIKLLDLTMDAIKQDGKILRVDAEIKIHRPIPDTWIDGENMLCHHWPMIKDPWYCPINTGHMMFSRSGLSFCEILKECILAMIPPDGDTLMPSSGEGHHIDDEWPSAMAIRLSKIQYVRERLKHDRRLPDVCAVNRGNWVDEGTVLTHPWIHNWNSIGGGTSSSFSTVTEPAFLNHYDGELAIGQMIAKMLLQRSESNLWNKVADSLDDGVYRSKGWTFCPKEGTCAPDQHWPRYKRSLI